mmetsp:Transcript_11325/g.36187  ORF Transcript_11325/g.36187 Transcript_11325/m.36187 type:complete len:261 (-) Transcript_11325:467-1249(-)
MRHLLSRSLPPASPDCSQRLVLSRGDSWQGPCSQPWEFKRRLPASAYNSVCPLAPHVPGAVKVLMVMMIIQCMSVSALLLRCSAAKPLSHLSRASSAWLQSPRLLIASRMLRSALCSTASRTCGGQNAPCMASQNSPTSCAGERPIRVCATSNSRCGDAAPVVGPPEASRLSELTHARTLRERNTGSGCSSNEGTLRPPTLAVGQHSTTTPRFLANSHKSGDSARATPCPSLRHIRCWSASATLGRVPGHSPAWIVIGTP